MEGVGDVGVPGGISVVDGLDRDEELDDPELDELEELELLLFDGLGGEPGLSVVVTGSSAIEVLSLSIGGKDCSKGTGVGDFGERLVPI